MVNSQVVQAGKGQKTISPARAKKLQRGKGNNSKSDIQARSSEQRGITTKNIVEGDEQ